MIIRYGATERAVGIDEEPTFGRSADNPVRVGLDPRDAAISRRAGRLRFRSLHWEVENTGSRSFYLVEPGGEVELVAAGSGRSSALLAYAYTWLRLPGEHVDHAVELQLEADELPSSGPPVGVSGDVSTAVEGPVTLTENELRSVVAVYESYLQLPPRYRREPRSFRAAAARLRVEEGKVKADLRRVQQKVADAGGPRAGGVRYRDVLVSWLMARQVVHHGHRDLLR